jgi:hypothetical protein
MAPAVTVSDGEDVRAGRRGPAPRAAVGLVLASALLAAAGPAFANDPKNGDERNGSPFGAFGGGRHTTPQAPPAHAPPGRNAAIVSGGKGETVKQLLAPDHVTFKNVPVGQIQSQSFYLEKGELMVSLDQDAFGGGRGEMWITIVGADGPALCERPRGACRLHVEVSGVYALVVHNAGPSVGTYVMQFSKLVAMPVLANPSKPKPH